MMNIGVASALPLDQFFPPDQLRIVAIPYLAPIGVLFVGNSVEFYARFAAVSLRTQRKARPWGKRFS